MGEAVDIAVYGANSRDRCPGGRRVALATAPPPACQAVDTIVPKFGLFRHSVAQKRASHAVSRSQAIIGSAASASRRAALPPGVADGLHQALVEGPYASGPSRSPQQHRRHLTPPSYRVDAPHIASRYSLAEVDDMPDSARLCRPGRVTVRPAGRRAAYLTASERSARDARHARRRPLPCWPAASFSQSRCARARSRALAHAAPLIAAGRCR